MAMSGKPLAMLIVGKHKPDAAGGAPPQDGGAKSALSIAQDLISGVEAKDPQAVAAALQAYCEVHEAGEPGEGEPDGDEGPPPT